MGKRTKEAEEKHWIELAEALDIEYVPAPKNKGKGRHRLIGSQNGFINVIKYGYHQGANRPVYVVVVRYADLLDPEFVETKLLERPEVKEIRGKLKIHKKTFELRKNFAWIVIPYHYKKDDVIGIAEKIREFLEIISVYARSLPREICEAPGHKFSPTAEPRLVFVNEFPQLLCEHCINEIPAAGRRAHDEYRKAPSNLGRGIIAGIGVAFLGSIVWALVAVFLNIVAALVSVIVLVGIIFLMDKVGTKRTGWSIFSAALLSVVSVVFGTYFSIVLYTIKEFSLEISIVLLVKSWQLLWEEPEIIQLSLFFSLLGLLPFLLLTWSTTKKGLSMIFKPKIEIIESK